MAKRSERATESLETQEARRAFADKRHRFLVDRLGAVKGEQVFAREQLVGFDQDKTWPNPWALGRE